MDLDWTCQLVICPYLELRPLLVEVVSSIFMDFPFWLASIMCWMRNVSSAINRVSMRRIYPSWAIGKSESVVTRLGLDLQKLDQKKSIRNMIK